MRAWIAAALLAVCAAGPATAQGLTGTLQKIDAAGAIVLGHRVSSPPFSFIDNDKQPAGYSVDLCLRVAEAVRQRLGRPDLQVRWVALEAEERLPKVVDGSIDLECGNTTVTLSREEQVDFSRMTFITGASLLTPAGSTIQGVGDLGGKRVAVVAGTTTEASLRARLAKSMVAATVVPVEDHDKAMKMLDKGDVDAHSGDQIVLIGLARAAKDPAKLALAPELFTYEPYALVVRRNDADFRLVADRTLAQLYRSGEIAQIYDKWFGDWGGRPSQLLLAMFALNGIPE